MNTHMTTSTDETASYPETVGDGDDQTDTRRMRPDVDERDPEEAGYGYGV